MKNYIVQFRETHDGDLIYLGHFTARSSLGALKQAIKNLHAPEECVEIVATEQGDGQ